MKIYFSLLSLCISSSAFTAQGPRAVGKQAKWSLFSTETEESVDTDFSAGARLSQNMPATYGGPGMGVPLTRQEAPAPMKKSSSMSSYYKDNAVSASPMARDGSTNLSEKATQMDTASQIKVQGNSLKTWSFQTSIIDRVQVIMKTEGRPLNANIDLWQGPDNIPQRMQVYSEDGDKRPINVILETPGGQNAIAIRNTNTMEFPLDASVEAEVDGKLNLGLKEDIESLSQSSIGRIVQGGAVFSKPFGSSVKSVQILLRTDGRPLNARIELLQGPNNNKQVLELYTEDGATRPFYMIMETPDQGCVIRIVNTATMEFPLSAKVEPYYIDDSPPSGVSSFFIVD